MEKINYQKKLDEIISSFSGHTPKPGLMLHSCCGPCSSYCLEYLKDHFDITVFYYNPNIYPSEEYEHRLAEQKRLIDEMNRHADCSIKLMTVPYDHQEFLEFVKGLEEEKEGGARCSKCFELRLVKTAEAAAEAGMDYFGTTLTVSPHKNAILINRIGGEITDREDLSAELKWLPSDFKKNDGYKRSIELSKEYELYRQNYCGCEFSIWF